MLREREHSKDVGVLWRGVHSLPRRQIHDKPHLEEVPKGAHHKRGGIPVFNLSLRRSSGNSQVRPAV
jgi:hypothetical protein